MKLLCVFILQLKILFVVNQIGTDWSVFLKSDVFSGNSTYIRVFDLIDGQIYINSNYFKANNTIEFNLQIGQFYSKKFLVIDQTNLTTINSMIVAWKKPYIFVMINCNLIGKIMFTNPDEINSLMIPTYRKNAILTGSNGLFYDSIKSSFFFAGCASYDLMFPSLQSTYFNNIVTQTSTTTTTTTTLMSPFKKLSNYNKIENKSEWSIVYDGYTSMLDNRYKSARLFQIDNNDDHICADYIFDNNTIQVFVVNDFDNRRTILFSKSSEMNVNQLIIIWMYPNLIFTVNCNLLSKVKFDNNQHLQSFSLPSYVQSSMLTLGKFYKKVNDALNSTGCLNVKSSSSSNSGENNRFSLDQIPTTTTTSIPTYAIDNSYSVKPPFNKHYSGDKLAEINTNTNIDLNNDYMFTGKKLEQKNFLVNSDYESMIQLNFDSVSSIYNTRMSQLENFLKLKQIFIDYNNFNARLYNFSLFNCN